MLAGLTIVELGGFIAGPFCAKLFADLGAQVIKIEAPGDGDPARAYGPFPHGRPHPEKSGLFLFLNGNKTGITLDVEKPEGREVLHEILALADVLVTERPRLLYSGPDEAGETARFQARYPALVSACITPFGVAGPLRDDPGNSLLCNALGAAAWAIGDPEREPLNLPFFQCEYQAGINAASAIMAALLMRRRSGTGQRIDISTADVIASYAASNATLYIYHGLQWRRDGRRAYRSSGCYPYGLFPCKDGYVCLIARTAREWGRFVESIGHPAWADQPRYQDQVAMAREYPEEVDALLGSALAGLTRRELYDLACKYEYPLAPVRNVAEAMEEPQLAHREFFVEVEHPEAGRLRLPGLPYHYSGFAPPSARPAPRLGEHTADFLTNRLGVSSQQLAALREGGIV
ncbi:MAG: CoA transferase [SAR324 cluster bacterium]|nr:CoA transferase [SAR324 cluster bacterium]